MEGRLGCCWYLLITCDCLLPPELYEYCIKEGYADKNLIAKWKKQGYENLCCLRCIQTRDTNFGTNCICRVPKSKLEVVSSSLFLCPAGVGISPSSGTAEGVVLLFLVIASAFAGRIGVQVMLKLLSALAFM